MMIIGGRLKMKEITAGPRYKCPISSKELQRRRDLVQKAMKEKGIDCMVTQAHSHIFDGYLRYFIDIPTGSYSSALIIPAEGDMVYIQHGNDSDNVPLPSWARGIEKIYARSYCLPFNFSDHDAAEVFVKEIKTHQYKRIGLVGMALISHSFGEYLRVNLPGAEFVNFSDDVDEIKAIKSEEEWTLINKSIRIHEQLVDTVPALFRPGRMEYEIRADLEHLALELGCDYIGNLAVGSAPSGQMARFAPHFYANRRVEPGDNLSVMIEVSGPGGQYGELARTWCLGEPTKSLQWLFDVAKNCQIYLADKIVPGFPASELNTLYDEYMKQNGLPPNARYFGHGQGYDMMERPAFASRENMVFKENMYLAVHPEIAKDNDFAICCDNFRVTKKGAVRLTRTPQEIFRVEI
jgi:Xaa-Pro aminopeptidase